MYNNIFLYSSYACLPSAIFQIGGGYQGAPEFQEQIGKKAIQLGIQHFHSNINDAVMDIVSHHIYDSIAPDGKESHNTAFASNKAALRSRHQRWPRVTSRSSSMSDTESKSSDGGEHFHRHMPNYQHGISSYSMGMRPRKSFSSGQSSLPTIAQSPRKHNTCSSPEAVSLVSDADNFQPNAGGDDNESLPFGSQASVSATNVMSLHFHITARVAHMELPPFCKQTVYYYILYYYYIYDYWKVAHPDFMAAMAESFCKISDKDINQYFGIGDLSQSSQHHVLQQILYLLSVCEWLHNGSAAEKGGSSMKTVKVRAWL